MNLKWSNTMKPTISVAKEEKTMIEKITDEIIALTVVGAATGCGVYITYVTGAMPESLIAMAGIVVGFYFRKNTTA